MNRKPKSKTIWDGLKLYYIRVEGNILFLDYMDYGMTPVTFFIDNEGRAITETP